MKHHRVLRVVSKLLIPYIILFALYVQFHGDFSPGGGFQAGVIVASAFILYGLIYGAAAVEQAAPGWLIRRLVALGVLIFAGTGVVAMLLGGNYLDYSVLAEDPKAGQHIGIMVIEFGVGLAVAASMITIFFAFAGRPQDGG